MRRTVFAVVALCATLIAGAACAVQPDEILKDPAQEARARSLSAEIRCLVCQNQSIDDSDASLARDLRLLVREQIAAGRSDQDIRDFLVERYGAFVLLNPPVQNSTLLLWFGPLIVLFCGVIGLIVFFRRRGHAALAGDGLSDAERARIERLLSERDSNEDGRA
jgi:cytochrome c-type biogenesis protein CcmH